MIQSQVKLKLTKRQEHDLDRWFYHLTSIWNWAIRKIELDARDGRYYSRRGFQDLLAGHGEKMGIPSHILRGVLLTAYDSWSRYLKGLVRRPRFKGQRNKLNSVFLPDRPRGIQKGRITVLGLRSVRFYKQELPDGVIKCCRIIKRASGWYLCLFIDAEPNAIPQCGSGSIGIDPGFNHLLTLSNGDKVSHPRELETASLRLAQAQRGKNWRLVSRIQERISNQRKNRNHKLSRLLVSENKLIAFSKDSHSKIARKFGKSVISSGHYQLRSMLSYKCRAGGRIYVEPDSKNSTRTCSACGTLTGPQGLAGLSVREWDCGACGAHHDRDTNSAMNALIAGAGLAHETLATAA